MNKVLLSVPVLIVVVVLVLPLVPTPPPPPQSESLLPSARTEFLAAHIDTVRTVMQDEIVSPSVVGEVVFPHQMHVDDFGLDCIDCHHEVNAAVLSIPHKDYFEDFWIDCTTCHHPNGETIQEAQSCSNCHPSHPRDIADQVLSAKVAIHQNCWECHDSGTASEASESCVFCHSGPKTGILPVPPDSSMTP